MENKIINAVSAICLRIIIEPMIYFSEADVQQLLVEELRKIPLLKKVALYECEEREEL